MQRKIVEFQPSLCYREREEGRWGEVEIEINRNKKRDTEIDRKIDR